MKTIFKTILTVLGTVILINGIALFFVSNVNLGSFLTVGFGGALIIVALLVKKLGKWLKILLTTGLGIAVVFSSFLIIYGKSDTATYKEDALIVLGAAVHGKTPSLTLKKRLDKAVNYHNQNPDAVIVVSGGQGNQEEISEAEAMKIYLVEHGVESDKIIKEDQSTSTSENFTLSKEILDEQFGDDYTTVFITNEYHILRANLCAKRADYNSIAHIHSNTTLSYLVSGVLRECLAVVKYGFFKS